MTGCLGYGFHRTPPHNRQRKPVHTYGDGSGNGLDGGSSHPDQVTRIRRRYAAIRHDDLVQNILRRFGIKHQHTTPYHPQTNGRRTHCWHIVLIRVRRQVCRRSSSSMEKSRAYHENIGSNTFKIWHHIEKKPQPGLKNEWCEKPGVERNNIERTPWVLEILC